MVLCAKLNVCTAVKERCCCTAGCFPEVVLLTGNTCLEPQNNEDRVLPHPVLRSAPVFLRKRVMATPLAWSFFWSGRCVTLCGCAGLKRQQNISRCMVDGYILI
ncbi:hypothetical protein ATANTOWER_032852 [Ataeniobius toweri]|uniref:Uncharacterized protein n=1 Tax=Ataeniobius toweri TaxID=208326 RepID=A0ABU7C7Q1_9TELE|nr:hypothetical protein [Ataeniobius toweri]